MEEIKAKNNQFVAQLPTRSKIFISEFPSFHKRHTGTELKKHDWF